MPTTTASALLPQVGSAPVTPIVLDPNVEYKYVIPVYKETSIAVTPVGGFVLSIAGRVLSIEYIGPPFTADTTTTIAITCTNPAGSVTHSVDFQVRGGLVIKADPSFSAACISGQVALLFKTTDTAPSSAKPINGQIKVGTKIKSIARTHGSAVTGIDAATLYVVSVNDALGKFNVSATSGGSPITPDASATYTFVIATAINASDQIYVGNYLTAHYPLNHQLQISYTDSQAMPVAYAGLTLYIKQVVDQWRIKLSATPGGSAIASGADSFPTDADVRVVLDTTGGRMYPAINSDPEISVEEETAIADYTLTSDIPADSYAVIGLPGGLSFDGVNKISGTPFDLDVQTRVTLIAYKDSHASYRYLLLNAPAGTIALDPDVIFDIAARKFYAPGGPAGRADRIEHYLNDPPIRWAFEQNGEPFTVPASSVVKFIIKTALNAATALTSGTKTLTVDRDIFDLGEDWTLAALSTDILTGGQKYVDLIAQLEVRLPSDPAGCYRKATIPFRLWNDEAQAGSGLIGTPSTTFSQSKPFSLLTTGVSTALDSVVTVNLAVDTWIAEVVRTVDGSLSESRWFLVDGTSAEDTDAGIVRPDDYNVSTNHKVWKRVSGL